MRRKRPRRRASGSDAPRGGEAEEAQKRWQRQRGEENSARHWAGGRMRGAAWRARALAAVLSVACCSAFFATPPAGTRQAHVPATCPRGPPTRDDRIAVRGLVATGWSWLWARRGTALASSGSGAGSVEKDEAKALLEELTVPEVATHRL